MSYSVLCYWITYHNNILASLQAFNVITPNSVTSKYLPVASIYSSANINVQRNCIDGVMVSVLTSSVVYRGFEPLSGETLLMKWWWGPICSRLTRLFGLLQC
jgi:hypothetical protein